MDRKTLVDILEEHLFVSDEWGGTKLASWKWGYNVCVDGIDETTDAILEYASQQSDSPDADIVAETKVYPTCDSYHDPWCFSTKSRR